MHLKHVSRSTTGPMAAAILLCALLGAMVPIQPVFSTTAALALISFSLLLASQITLRQMILGSILITILGYMFVGRGFAYVGVGPIFIGEFMLVAAAIVAITSPKRRRTLAPVTAASLFIVYGVLRTLPYVEAFGLNAIRDAALYYYILFGVLLYFALSEREVRAGFRIIGEAIPFYLGWSLIQLGNDAVGFLPRIQWPGAPVGMLVTKPGDRAVVLAVIAAYTLLGLPKLLGVKFQVPSAVFWSTWLGLAAVAAVGARGGLLAIFISLAVVIAYRRSRELLRMMLIGAAVMVVIVIWNPSFKVGGYREVSIEQFSTNVTSIFGATPENSGGVNQNRDWRLEFWKTTVSHTLQTDQRWFGMGYGINLATDAGFQINSAHDLRSPHNIFVTVLGRMGIFGIIVWGWLIGSFLFVLHRVADRAREVGDEMIAAVMVLGIAYTAAVLMNATFDVYLEGPQGAIPFWSAFGAILVLAGPIPRQQPPGQRISKRP